MSLRPSCRRVVAGLAAGLVVAIPASPALAQELTFRFDGRGYGHGVGMSQWGAYGLARKGWDADRILRHYYTGVTDATRPDEPVRVLLNSGPGSPAVSLVGYDGPASAYLLPAPTPVPLASGAEYVVRYTADGARLESAAGEVLGTSAVGVRVRPAGDGLAVGAKGIRYAGTVTATPAGGGLTVINTVSRERYLRGVVPREAIPSWASDGAAALQAQAVAARSYVQRRVGSSRGYDVVPSTGDQVYGGISAEDPRTDAAVVATANRVLTYDGVPINAMYSSTMGGHTEDYVNVFGGGDVPYLKGVPDPDDPLAVRWTTPPVYTATELGSALGMDGPVATFTVTARMVSPRVKTAVVTSVSGQSRTFTGPEIKEKVNRAMPEARELRDIWFWVTRSDQATPTPEPPVAGQEPPATTTPSPATPPRAGTPSPSRPVSDVVRKGRWMVVAVRTPQRARAAQTAKRLRTARPQRVMFRQRVAPRRYIVATGRYAAYPEALRERAALRRLKIRAVIVQALPGYPAVPRTRRWPAPTATLNRTAVPAPSQQGRFRVVVAEVGTQGEADAVLKRLRGHRPTPRVVSQWTPVGGTRYLIVTLTAGSAARAASEVRGLVAKGFPSARREPAPAT